MNMNNKTINQDGMLFENRDDYRESMYIVSDVASRFSELHWRVFEIIVSNGISRQKEAIEKAVETLPFVMKKYVGTDSVWRAIDYLISIRIFFVKQISTGLKPFKILILSDVGVMLYINTFKRNPAETEYETLIREHGSAEHGYLIKAAEEIMKKVYKFERTTTGRSENRIPLSGGLGCIPDIIGYGPNKKVFVEVECGTHNYVDFCEKCDRLMQITPAIYFIVKSRSIAKEKLLPQIQYWVKKNRTKLLQNGTKVYLASIKDFQRKYITYIFDPMHDEPICFFERKKPDANQTKVN